MKTYLDIIKERRSIYQINNQLTISEDEIIDMIQKLIVELPSAFHSQSVRVVVLFQEAHLKLWDITKEALRKRVDPNKFESTEQKLKSFADGYGTILFFDETSITDDFKRNFPLYADNFPVWANQSNAIAQFAIWTALANQGIGASLQHYNPIIDVEVKKEFGISESYQLIAQMPFGGIISPAGIKESKPVEQLVAIKR